MQKQAKLEVVLPQVKIRIEDLSYLRGLLEAERPGKPKCIRPRGNDSRLRVLGLIQDIEIAPCPEDIKKYAEKIKDAKRVITKATSSEPWDWPALYNFSFWDVRHGKPKPRTVTRVTEAGKKLLADGMAKVVVQKSCQ